MTSAPVVSVILTSYNQAPWLRESVASVLAQTYRDWELILIDNGSTDGSAAIAREFDDHPQITVVCHERNTPHTVICNQAVQRARGRYVSFLYSDDYYLPTKLERQVARFATLPDRYGVVYCGAYRLMAAGGLAEEPIIPLDGDVLETLLTGPQLFRPIAPLILRECLLRYPFNESIFMEGEGVYTKIALRYHFHPLPERLVVMRDHEGNMGKEIAPNLKRGLAMCEAIFRHPEFPEALQRLKGRLLADTYTLGGWQTIRRERQYAQGGAWLRAAVAANPRSLRNPRVLAGLGLAALPRRIANACQTLIDRVAGAPPPPVARPSTPVEGRAPSSTY